MKTPKIKIKSGKEPTIKNGPGLGTKSAITKVRKYFPQVNNVVDAKDSIQVSVNEQDSKSGRRKDPGNCALARACTRQGADGAIINIGYSYLIKGDTATRYKTSVGVGREITSFDRHQDFAEGKDYLLSKVAPANCLGAREGESGKGGHKRGNPKPPVAVHHHRTARIRVAKAK